MENKETQPLMLFDKQAREKLLEGVTLVYKAVVSTLSPKGRNVAIKRQWGIPIVVHDGVTVAREVKSPDRFADIGIRLVREAAQKTNEEAGDGTTTSTLIAYEVVSRGMKLIDQGTNPMILRDEIVTALNEIKGYLPKLTKLTKKQEDLIRVATISSASEDIGKLVGEVAYKVGVDGLISVEESGGYDTIVDHADGMVLDKGFISPYFITNTNRMESVIDNPVIIISDRSFTTNNEIMPLLEKIVNAGHKNIVFIGEVSGDALSSLVLNKTRGVLNCLAVKTPSYGEFGQGLLEDIAVLTGGIVISKDMGMSTDQLVEQFKIEWLGKAKKIVADRKNTMIVKGAGYAKSVSDHIATLKGLLADAPSLAEREHLEERIAKLTSGVSVIRVGAKTEIEGREKVERVKDAVGAAQSALREGIVAGSGVTFLRLAKAITGDSVGANLMREVLECPVKKVMENSGEPEKIIRDYLAQIKESKQLDYGYESLSGKLDNMYKVGVIDPAKVIRLCLENGISVATSILTTDTLIDFVEQNVPQS